MPHQIANGFRTALARRGSESDWPLLDDQATSRARATTVAAKRAAAQLIVDLDAGLAAMIDDVRSRLGGGR